MAGDEDLARLLPDAPPRPEPRGAAIEAAMRRFDGEVPTEARRHRHRQRPGWTRIGRAPLGALVSAALVAAIGIPVALRVIEQQGPVAQPAPRMAPAALPAEDHLASAMDAAPPPAPAPSAIPHAAETAPPGSAQPAATQVQAKTASPTPSGIVASAPPRPMAPPAPPPPPPPPPPPAAMAQRALAASDREALGATASSARAGASAVPVAGARLARRDFTAASPVVAAESDNGAASIVVTGSRVGKAAANAARRGDWNACTVDDPDRRLDRCERQVNPKAKGDAGRAAARIADGLEKAWAGDMDAAIAAFDAAIAIRPEDAFAHLNRGLALRQRGEIEQAVAEYDAAIRYAPQEARGYYHRSVALRAMGETKRAERDEERAVSLDSRYEELVE